MKIKGKIVSGKQLGRTIGFPTANLQPDSSPEIKNGVYAAWFCLEEMRLPCMLNIGRHPTVPDGAPTIEAHVIDFSGDLYGLSASLTALHFLRPERKFESLDALKAQLARDLQTTREFFQEEENA